MLHDIENPGHVMGRRGLLVACVVLALHGRGAAQGVPLEAVVDLSQNSQTIQTAGDSAQVPAGEQKGSKQADEKGEGESTANELNKLREAVEKLTKNANVSVGEGLSLRIFGTLQGTLTYSTTRPVAPGTEMYLTPASPFGFDSQTVDIHARASSLGAVVTGPKVGGWDTRGLIMVYFYSEDLISDRYGILPYQIWGDIKNEDWRFAAGLQKDLFNPLDPTMLTFGLIYGSGNGGNYRGQFRIERYVKHADDVQWTFQAALSEPIATTVSKELGISEDNGWPNVEFRTTLGLGKLEGEGPEARRRVEVGVSGVIGQIRNAEPLVRRRVVADVRGLGVDARVKLNECMGVQGELFAGQTLGTYNGGILQDVNSIDLHGIRSAGAWFEVYYYLVPEKLHAHAGYGIDDPLDRDVAPGQRLRNETYFANMIWDVTKAFRIGVEATWRETAYKSLRNNEGASLQTVIQWSF